MINWLLYLVVVLIWGSTWLAIKWQLGIVAPEISIFYRFATASLLLIFYCLLRRINLKFPPKNHLFLFLMGAGMFSLNYIFLYQATFYLISGLVSVIFSLVSLFNILNNYLFFKIRPTKFVLSGAALGLCGISTIFWKDLIHISFQDQILIGIGLALIATLVFSFGNIASRYNQLQGMRLVSSTAIAMGYGVLIMLAYIWLNDIPFSWSNEWKYVGSLFYLAVPGSIVAFLCYLSLISRIGINRAGYATVFFPVIALLFSFFAESYQWHLTDFVGIGTVILGNLLIMTRFD
ncbi:MAG TPA: DMT family transporter [Chlamydiales bacterium]|nr:DMT family transporter [Chlamydiales bacterium]